MGNKCRGSLCAFAVAIALFAMLQPLHAKPADPPSALVGSCADGCGGHSGDACWCDESCSERGDCCADCGTWFPVKL